MVFKLTNYLGFFDNERLAATIAQLNASKRITVVASGINEVEQGVSALAVIMSQLTE